MSQSSARPIPWSHELTDFGSLWLWDTDHFRVTVNGDGRSCYYTISDKSSGQLKPFADGTRGTFHDAEEAVKETIAKAYPADLGYRAYAGSLATTFLLGTGQRVDLGVYENTYITVTASTGQGQTQQYAGIARVEHYELVLTAGQVEVRVLPHRIVKIDGLVRNQAAAPTLAKARTMPGMVEPGCTGTPGFLANTVVHTGVECPVHER